MQVENSTSIKKFLPFSRQTLNTMFAIVAGKISLVSNLSSTTSVSKPPTGSNDTKLSGPTS